MTQIDHQSSHQKMPSADALRWIFGFEFSIARRERSIPILLVSIRTLVSPFFLLRIESGKAPLIESKLRRILKYFPEIECQKQIDQYWKESVS